MVMLERYVITPAISLLRAREDLLSLVAHWSVRLSTFPQLA